MDLGKWPVLGRIRFGYLQYILVQLCVIRDL